MGLEYKYNAQYAGKVYAGKTLYSYIGTDWGGHPFAGALFFNWETKEQMGTRQQLTGIYLTYKDKNYYQTTTGRYIIPEEWSYQKTEGLPNGNTKLAQSYVDGIIRANAHIFKNNLLCARFADRLNDKERLDLYLLQTRMEDRNETLITSGLCSDIKVSSPPGYRDLFPYLEDFVKSYRWSKTDDGIGAIVMGTTAVIVVSCIVIASLGTAAYFAYKALYNQSQDDVKFSDELTKTLTSKLTEEEYSQLLNETQGIVTKAKIRSSLGNLGGLLKWGLIAAGGVVIYKMLRK